MPKQKLSPLVTLAIEAAEEVKAVDLKLLDVQKLTPMTDYMLICTGTSNRHVRSIAENVALRAKLAGFGHARTQGASQSEWVLVDLGGIVVHVMQLQARAFYQLEKLWGMDEVAPKTESAPAKQPKATPKKKQTKVNKKAAKSGRKPQRGFSKKGAPRQKTTGSAHKPRSGLSLKKPKRR